MALMMKTTWKAVLFVVISVRLGVSQEESTELTEPGAKEPCSRWMRGVNGTPGFNGMHGRDGRDGRDGEKGDIGDPGSDGQNGDPGEPGDEGPGGKRGFPGNPGQKGEIGESSFPYHSAFSMGLTHKITSASGAPIRFTKTYFNEQHHYNEISGKFRSTIPGIYYFTYHLTVHGKEAKVALFQNGRTVAFTLDQYHSGNLDQASGAAILNLAAGDEIWLQLYGEDTLDAGIYADNNYSSTFSGFLLTPKILSSPYDNRRR
ncbi:adiponectin isoform X1 [Paramisgurnus dabryanus]|uniref:adiponectin isoform X1 n=2 Tax=Paramisgurnus dabryanus TaxID=90735 RepID=UPI0031F37BA6